MINQLIKLASHLDKKGFLKEADYLDALIKKKSSSDWADNLGGSVPDHFMEQLLKLDLEEQKSAITNLLEGKNKKELLEHLDNITKMMYEEHMTGEQSPSSSGFELQRSHSGDLKKIWQEAQVMINRLIKLANHLDSKGLTKEADYLDAAIRKYSAIDDEEQRILTKLKDLLLNRTPHEKEMDDEMHKNDYVPSEVKDKIWAWMNDSGRIGEEYRGKTWQEAEQIEKDKGPEGEILFWEITRGSRGYDEAKDIGFTTGSEEDGTLKVYMGGI